MVASLTYNRTPRGFFTMMGDGVDKAAQALEAAGADAIGSNCGLGSADMVDLAAALRAATRLPILVQPNAGQPVVEERLHGLPADALRVRGGRPEDQDGRRRHDRRVLRHHPGVHSGARPGSALTAF